MLLNALPECLDLVSRDLAEIKTMADIVGDDRDEESAARRGISILAQVALSKVQIMKIMITKRAELPAPVAAKKERLAGVAEDDPEAEEEEEESGSNVARSRWRAPDRGFMA